MQSRWRMWGPVAVSAALLVAGAIAAEPTKDTLAAVKQSVAAEKAVLMDVREKSEWDSGHLSGAVFLPLSELRNGITAESLAQRIPKDRIIYTHCAVGMRSCAAADILLKHGYDVRALKPGYKALLAAGFKKADK
ncbi:MAG: rhodanese-like domain-containing protein [Planctomycetaceae bacterium]